MKSKSVLIKLLILVAGIASVLLLSSCLMPGRGCFCFRRDDVDEDEDGYGVTYVLKEGGESYYVASVGYNETEVIIPEYYMGLPVTGIADGAFVHYIPPAGCSGGYAEPVDLRSLTLPESIATIENGAFLYFGTIYNINFKGTVEDWCNIKFGSSPVSQDTKLYIDGTLVKDLIVPGTVSTVSSGAFENYSYLESVIFEDGVKTVGSFAFCNCNELLSVVVPSTMKAINHNAFSNCPNLLEVYNFSPLEIQKGSSAYGEIALNAYSVLTSPDEESLIKVEGDYVFAKTETENFLFRYKGDGGNILLPDDIDGESYAIRSNTFKENDEITAVTLGNKVTSIGEAAFYNCDNLVRIAGGNSLESIDKEAFYGCSSLASIDLSKVKNIGEYAFGYCYGLKEVNLSGLNADGLSNYAFAYCSKLSDIIFPDNLTVIPQGAFYRCASLKTLSLPAVAKCTIAAHAFSQCNALENLVIPAGYEIGGEAFSYCTALKSVEIHCKNVEGLSFYQCANLESVTLNEGVESVELQAFMATNVKTVHFPASCKDVVAYAQCRLLNFTVEEGNPYLECKNDCLIKLSEKEEEKVLLLGTENSVIPDDGSVCVIGDYAFALCNLQSIVVPSSVTKIKWNAFSGSALEEIDLSNVTYIGFQAFKDCKELAAVTLGEGLRNIMSEAFAGCIKLTSINLPQSLITMGDGTFESSGLESIVIPENITLIGTYCFAYCDNLSEITLPSGFKKIGYKAFDNTNGCNPLIVHYKGTKEEWQALGLYFPYGATIDCSDGKYES